MTKMEATGTSKHAAQYSVPRFGWVVFTPVDNLTMMARSHPRQSQGEAHALATQWNRDAQAGLQPNYEL